MTNIIKNYYRFYNDQYPVNIMVIGKTICDRNYYVHRSCSGIMALEYISKGSGTLQINGKTYCPGENTAVLLTKESCHTYFTDPDDRWEKRWIVFDGELMSELINKYIPEEEYCFENCNLSHFFDDINRTAENYMNDYEQMTDNISVIIHRMFIYIKNRTKKGEYDLPEQIRHYLDSNLENKITIDVLCTIFNYSKNYIIRVFKERYGITPYRYFLERKIDVAKLYLCNTKYTVNEIAQILKFADQHYFSTEFSRFEGISPKEYRKKFTSK